MISLLSIEIFDCQKNNLTSEYLVATLTTQHHLDTHRLDLATQKVHGRASANSRNVVRLQMVNNVWDCIQTFLHSKDVFVMNSP